MQNIILTDADNHSACVFYVYNALISYLPKSGPAPKLFKNDSRIVLCFDKSALSDTVKRILTDLIAETLGVGYKYAYLSQRLPLPQLSPAERKIFLCALISADLPADKKIIVDRIKNEEFPLALDGLYAFRLQELREKWLNVISYIPPDFSLRESESFFKYFVKGNVGKAYLYAGEVYDDKYRICRRRQLVGGGEELKAETEIVLSGAREVHIALPMAEKNEGESVGVSTAARSFLQRYYGNNVFFH